MYSGKLRDDLLDRLFEAILLLNDTDECYRFFEDICTVAELKALAQRLEVAKTGPTVRSQTEPAPALPPSAG
jgi:TrpR-related protein YerC/YecD